MSTSQSKTVSFLHSSAGGLQTESLVENDK